MRDSDFPALTDPDRSSEGLLKEAPEALRYATGEDRSAHESPGICRKMMPSYARVLDVGCGAGGGTWAINRDKHNDIVCIEPDPIRAARARATGLEVRACNLHLGLVEQLGQFDVVVFADVLEHVASPAELLQIARAILVPGGLIIISVPNVAHWTVRLKLLFGRFDYASQGIMDSTHLRWFTLRTLSNLVTSQGFEVIDVKHSSGAFLPSYKLIPSRIRHRVVRTLTRVVPLLMGFQHIMLAQSR